MMPVYNQTPPRLHRTPSSDSLASLLSSIHPLEQFASPMSSHPYRGSAPPVLETSKPLYLDEMYQQLQLQKLLVGKGSTHGESVTESNYRLSVEGGVDSSEGVYSNPGWMQQQEERGMEGMFDAGADTTYLDTVNEDTCALNEVSPIADLFNGYAPAAASYHGHGIEEDRELGMGMGYDHADEDRDEDIWRYSNADSSGVNDGPPVVGLYR